MARRVAPLALAAVFLTAIIDNAAAQGQAPPRHHGSIIGPAPPQIALIAGRMVHTLAPTGEPTATVFATTVGRAEAILDGTRRRRSPSNRKAAQLITVRGRALRRGQPVGRTLFGFTIWIPNGAESESGILRRAPKGLARLGRGTTYDLRLPPPPAAPVTLRPLAGIGPVSLGDSRAAVQRALGPWLLGTADNSEFALGAGELDVGFDHGRVEELVAHDPAAVLDGVRLGAGYSVLAAELHGWHTVRCTAAQNMLVLDARGGRTTGLLFDRDRFAALNIGAAGTGGCPPWPASFLASPVGQL
jgi:hypothetical protein